VNYTDRATAACRRSLFQLLRIEVCRMVSAAVPYGRNLDWNMFRLLNFTTGVCVNKLQFYYLLSVIFCWLCSSVLFSSVFTIQVKVKVTIQLTVSQSVCQGIELILGLVARYYFLSEGFFFLKFAVLFFWGALSDERLGLSFVFLCLVICHYLHKIFTLHVFYSSAIYIQ
jgi:hypothetical protein